jgi:NitT/TauT family transport system substrate-binding protein
LRHHGLQSGKDIDVTVTASPLEAMQLLVLGRVDAALVPEPAASAAIVRGAVAGKTIQRVIDIQQEWGRLTGKGQTLPQAGLAVTDGFRDQHGAVLAALQQALVETVADVVAHPARAANSAAVTLQMPWPVIEKAIHFSNLVAIPASQARSSIEAMLAPVAEDNAAIIGGRLPDPAFYL